MIKKRLIAQLLIKEGWVVQSFGFNRYLPVGRPEIAVEHLCRWGIDDIILLDISARSNGCTIPMEIIETCAMHCSVPLTVGGGISSVKTMETMINKGADKIWINNPLIRDMSLLQDAVKVLGAQCMVVGVDITKNKENYSLYNYRTKRIIKKNWKEYIRACADFGAGEICITAVHNDGAALGYDIELIQQAQSLINQPIIAAGGAGCARHVADLFSQANVAAASVGNILHYSEHSVALIKTIMDTNVPIRHDIGFEYSLDSIGDDGRLTKLSDSHLEDLIFAKVEKDIV